MSCKLGITSMSLGWATKAGHSLETKLALAHKYGYKGIELFHDDLDDLAARRFEDQSPSQPSDSECRSSHKAQLAAAAHIRHLCHEFDLTIICLQPFSGYEGLLDAEAKAKKLEKLHRWIELAHVLETDIIQIPSSFEPAEKVADSRERIVADLQVVADVGLKAEPVIRFVYEALAWGTRIDTWEQSWDVVKRVDRANFGLCLDSFNIAGRIYADPTDPSGTTGDAMQTVEYSMKQLVREVDVEKVFYVQIVDAERLETPLVEGHEFHVPSQPPRMSWSRNCRLFYGEEDRRAYLPVQRIAQAFFRELGFKGWVSLELFNRRMSDKDEAVPEELARRGAESWKKLVKDFDLEQGVEPAPPAARSGPAKNPPRPEVSSLPSSSATPEAESAAGQAERNQEPAHLEAGGQRLAAVRTRVQRMVRAM